MCRIMMWCGENAVKRVFRVYFTAWESESEEFVMTGFCVTQQAALVCFSNFKREEKEKLVKNIYIFSGNGNYLVFFFWMCHKLKK